MQTRWDYLVTWCESGEEMTTLKYYGEEYWELVSSREIEFGVVQFIFKKPR